MRIVMNQYADGDKFAVESTTDGGVPIRDLLGERKVGARICAFVELACDDTEKGLQRLEESLQFLLEEVQKRRSQPAGV